jgi:hypothetical protein
MHHSYILKIHDGDESDDEYKERAGMAELFAREARAYQRK